MYPTPITTDDESLTTSSISEFERVKSLRPHSEVKYCGSICRYLRQVSVALGFGGTREVRHAR